MQEKLLNRSSFIRNVTLAGAAISLPSIFSSVTARNLTTEKRRVGIIGLDTSHCIALTKLLNAANPLPDFEGYKVIAAYPFGSRDISSSAERIPEYTETIKKYGVEIVPSIDELLKRVDDVLLLTNDGRIHLEQVTPVIKAGKSVYINKPMAASLKDANAIFEMANQYSVPVFSSSALRYVSNLQEIRSGKWGKVLGADVFSPAALEKTHPDLFWYGIHGVESLYTVMGTGCREVVRIHTDGTDMTVGTWDDGRIGAVRGTRTGKHLYGGTIYTETGDITMGQHEGYTNLLKVITNFFTTGVIPVSAAETLEIMAFMEAADLSKQKGGVPVKMEVIFSQLQTS